MAVVLTALAISGIGAALLIHTIGLPWVIANAFGDRLPALPPEFDALRLAMRPFVLAGILAVMAGLGTCTVRLGEREGTRWQTRWHWQPDTPRQRALAIGLGVALVVLLELMFLVGTGYGSSDPRNDFRWELLWSATAQIEAGVVVAGAVVGRWAWRWMSRRVRPV